jgi:hypothetical protein
MEEPIKPSILRNHNQIAWTLRLLAIHIAIVLSVCPKLSGDSSPFGNWTRQLVALQQLHLQPIAEKALLDTRDVRE